MRRIGKRIPAAAGLCASAPATTGAAARGRDGSDDASGRAGATATALGVAAAAADGQEAERRSARGSSPGSRASPGVDQSAPAGASAARGGAAPQEDRMGAETAGVGASASKAART